MINLWVNHTLSLPVAWSQNVIFVKVNFPSRPSKAVLHLTVHEVGKWYLGYKVKFVPPFYDLALGFTVNVNGYDVYVIHPVTETGEITIDVTDRVLRGDNNFYAVIWRNPINLFVSFYVTFTLTLEADVEGEVRPIEIPPYGGVNWITTLSGLGEWILKFLQQLMTLLLVATLLPLIVDVIGRMIPKGRREEKE